MAGLAAIPLGILALSVVAAGLDAATMARATHIPNREREALLSMAQFHQAAVRLLQTLVAAI